MPPAAQQQQQDQRGSGWSSVIMRMVLMYFVFNMVFKNRNTPAPSKDSDGKPLPPHGNLFSPDQAFELRIYLSENDNFTDFTNTSALIWHEEDLKFNWDESNHRQQTISFPTPQLLQNNGTVYAHVFITREGFSHIPSSPDYFPSASFYTRGRLVKYAPRRKVVTTKNLISQDKEENVQPVSPPTASNEFISYWKPNLTLNLIVDGTKYSRGGIPPQIQDHLRFNEEGQYYPVLFFNDFWVTKDDWIPLNETVKILNLTMEYYPLSLMKWQMMLQMEQSFALQQSMGTAVEEESDEFKRMIVETNPYLLGLTAIVTLLHTVFDFLAFKNDIVFWKNRKSVEGISVRSMFINFVCQVVIFFYLMDNETSWLILISAGIGLAIEAWKIQKAVIVEFDRTKWIPITLKDRESYVSRTKEHDAVAIRYLSYVAYPLVVAYSIYSLVYNTHKSWYSWILSSLVGCVYTFGFLLMTPQLFINYKLKSVAHLPWRTFMYKALNTVIDDLFAFIIKMPTMHRLSCFRDDIVFLIYLYQRWIYPTDYSRVNEFGQGGANSEADKQPPKEGEKPQEEQKPSEEPKQEEKTQEAKKED